MKTSLQQFSILIGDIRQLKRKENIKWCYFKIYNADGVQNLKRWHIVLKGV